MGGSGAGGAGGGTMQNSKLFTIGKSVITNLVLNYDPQSVVSFHKDGNPVQIDMTVTFQEIELQINTKDSTGNGFDRLVNQTAVNQNQSSSQTTSEQQAAQRRKKMAEIFQGQGLSSIQPNVQAQGTQNAGNRGFFGGVGDFFGNIGEGISTGFGTALGNLFGGNRPRGVGQQPAVTTVTNVGAQESQGSGSIQAGFGSLLPSVIGAARGLIKSPIGSLVTGTGIGTAISMIGADGKPMRVTRKMKAQARSLLNMTGGNLAMTANFLNISDDQLVFILLKRFRNDGPVVTKAALRKTN